MQIVIDIPNENYQIVLSKIMLACYGCKITELPKGHGRLIDADMVVEDIDTERVNLFMDGLKGTPRGYEHLNDLQRIMDEIPTIIEADKEGDNADSN